MSDPLWPHGLSVEFSRPESWSRQPVRSPGDLPHPGIKPRSPTLQADSLPPEPPGKPKAILKYKIKSKPKLYSTTKYKVKKMLFWQSSLIPLLLNYFFQFLFFLMLLFIVNICKYNWFFMIILNLVNLLNSFILTFFHDFPFLRIFI